MPESTETRPTPAEMVAAMIAADRASTALGIEVLAVGTGTATVSVHVTDSMVNGHGTVHGGYVFLVADTAFACACNSHGPVTVAAAADITFVRPARVGDVLVAEAIERTKFGRNGIYDVTVFREDTGGRTVIAEFRGRSRTADTSR